MNRFGLGTESNYKYIVSKQSKNKYQRAKNEKKPLVIF